MTNTTEFSWQSSFFHKAAGSSSIKHGVSKARFHRECMPDLCSDLVKYPSIYTLYDHFREIERSEKPRCESREDAPKRLASVKPAPIVSKPVKTTTVGSNLRVAELSLEAVERIDLRYADRSRHEVRLLCRHFWGGLV